MLSHLLCDLCLNRYKTVGHTGWNTALFDSMHEIIKQIARSKY